MLNLIKLESRIVLDGAGVGEAVGHAADHDAHAHGNSEKDVPDHENHGAQKATVAEAAALLADAPEAAPEPLDIVLVSDNLPDYQTLVDAVNPQAQVIVYHGGSEHDGDADAESAQDVIDRVTALSQESGQPIHSLTVLSHGGAGYFNLGNEMVTAENLDDNADAWSDLDDAMADDGHIYVYGCNVANGSESGQNLLNSLSDITGAEVFGSDDITGGGGNGDWDLEATSDDTDHQANPPINSELLADYAGYLTTAVPASITTTEDEPASFGIFIFGPDENSGSRISSDVRLDSFQPSDLIDDAQVFYEGWITNRPRNINGVLVNEYHLWTVNYDPVKDANGNGNLGFTVREQGQSPDVFETDVTILPVNDPPVAFDDSIITDEDTPITDFMTGDDPVENDDIVFSIVEQPEHGTITNFNSATGRFTYNPDQDYNGPDSFKFQVDDQQSENNLSDLATIDIIVNPVPDKPEVETSEGNAEYIENDPPVAVDPDVTVTDVDSESLGGAEVQITNNYQNDDRGQDILRFTNQNGIVGSWDASTGTLTLTGDATIAQYEEALQSVHYEHIGGVRDGDDPNENVRTVTFSVTDETDLTSDPASRGVFVDAINDAPELNPETGIVTYVEKCGPIDLGDFGDNFQINDVDDDNMTQAEIQITDGYRQGEDVLQFTNTAGISGSWNAATGTLTLAGTASKAAYAAALESVTYDNTGDAVDPGSRTLTITITDANSRGVGDGPGGGFKTDTVSRNLDMTINDPPVLDLDTTDGTPEAGTPPSEISEEDVDYSTEYITGTDGVLLTNGGVVLDTDDTHLSQLRVEIREGQDGRVEGDVLGFNTEGTNISGSYDPSTGTLLLTGVDTIQHYQTVLNSITFYNSRDRLSDSEMGIREIEFRATDNTGNTCDFNFKDSNIAVASVAVLPGGPDLENVEDVSTFIENCGPVLIAENATVESPTGRMIQELSVSITNVQPNDILYADVSGSNISMSYQNGVLRFSGADTAENYQQVLRTVSFENSSEAPNSLQRVITYQVTDTEGQGDNMEALANVVPVNDAPINQLPDQIVAPVNTSIAIDNISINDVDAGNGQVLVTLRSDFGVIQVISDGSGAEIDNNGGSIVTIEGTVPQVNAALQGLNYTPLTDFSGEDRLTITVNDQGWTGVHPTNNVQANCSGLIGITLDQNGQVPTFPGEGTPQDPTALQDEDVIVINVTESDINVVPETPEPPDVPFLPITRPEGRDLDGITLETVRLPGPVGITEGVGRPIFESRALAGRDFFDFCSIEESLRSHLGCRFANTGNPEAQFGSVSWGDFTDLGWKPPYEEHLDEEYDLYTQLFIREQGDPGFNVEANEFQRDLGGLAEQPPQVFEETAGGVGFNEMQPGEVKKTFFAGREQLDKTGR